MTATADGCGGMKAGLAFVTAFDNGGGGGGFEEARTADGGAGGGTLDGVNDGRDERLGVAIGGDAPVVVASVGSGVPEKRPGRELVCGTDERRDLSVAVFLFLKSEECPTEGTVDADPLNADFFSVTFVSGLFLAEARLAPSPTFEFFEVASKWALGGLKSEALLEDGLMVFRLCIVDETRELRWVFSDERPVSRLSPLLSLQDESTPIISIPLLNPFS